jgi:hypothetical protein
MSMPRDGRKNNYFYSQTLYRTKHMVPANINSASERILFHANTIVLYEIDHFRKKKMKKRN